MGQDSRNIIRDLGIVSQLRGVDACGIISLTKDKDGNQNYKVNKLGESASYVLYNGEVNDTFFDNEVFAILGHCRSATVGSLSDENAHPFIVDKIVGMHNGTIPAFTGGKINGVPITDSQVLFNRLNSVGLARMIKESNSGAMALCWLNSEEGTINFYRNYERTLYFMKALDVMYYSSEYDMLSFIKSRSGLTTWDYPKLLEAGHHLSFSLVDRTWKKTKIEEEKTYLPFSNFNRPAITPPAGMTAIPLPPPKEQKPASTDYSQYASTITYKYRAFRGKCMNLKKAIKLLQRGCAFNADHRCTSADETYWFNNKSYLCKVCAKDPFIREAVSATRLYKAEKIAIN